MNAKKQKTLEAKGWKVTTVTEFLCLTPEEEAYIELKLILSKALKARRNRLAMTQEQVAKSALTNQARIAKMEASDPSVTIDSMLKALIATGATPREIGKELVAASPAPTRAKALTRTKASTLRAAATT